MTLLLAGLGLGLYWGAMLYYVRRDRGMVTNWFERAARSLESITISTRYANASAMRANRAIVRITNILREE